MNLVHLLKNIGFYFSIIVDDLYFHLVKNFFYYISFNTSGNTYACKGKMRKSCLMMLGKGNCVFVADGCLLNKVKIDISGNDNKLILHEGVKFGEGGRIRIEDYGNTIEIGENTTLINCFLSSADKNTTIKIGKNCLLSSDVIIRSSDSHSIVKDGTPERLNAGANVIIGDHVWICNGSRILKGSEVGANSVVGSNSLISGQKVGNNNLIVGNPCKVVKVGINWCTTRLF